MIFREAIIADIPQMMRIRLLVTENRLTNPALVTPEICADFLLNRGKAWLCEIDDAAVGFAIADLLDGMVWALFVQPGYEGKGIGRKLHDDMLHWYFTTTGRMIWLTTGRGTRAETFYRKAGWKHTAVQFNGEIKFEMTLQQWKKHQKMP